ncbi:MAG: DUF3194 domain-containing protein [Candidatus Thorarchaeota archaeon]|nr:DUF3194 domain-containing protein [Candidatus Thorarchaeota archaeon]
MTPTVEIGLPELDEERIGQLAEECEHEISNYIFNTVPRKSIDDLVVICSLALSEQLDIDIVIEITQKYDTGTNLNEAIESASEFGSDWLQKRLMEMKND